MWTIVTPAQLWLSLSAPFVVCSAARAGYTNVSGARGVFAYPLFGLIALAGYALLVGVVALQARDFASALQIVIVLSALGYLAAFDVHCLAIPVWPVAVLAALGLAFSFLDGAGLERGCAALVGFASLRILDVAYVKFRGRSGLGAGDALIVGLIGAWFSFEILAWAVALGGAATLAWALISQKGRQTPMPLAPGLAVGCLFALLLGSFAS